MSVTEELFSIALLLCKLLRVKEGREGTTCLAGTMREKKGFRQKKKKKRKEKRHREEKEQEERASPGNKLEIMDLFDIRPQSGQPIQRGTRPNCN